MITYRKILAIPLLLTAMLGCNIANADCASNEAHVLQQIQDMSRDAVYAQSVCEAAQITESVAAMTANFYQNCRLADPSGSSLQGARQLLDWARDTQRQACSNW